MNFAIRKAFIATTAATLTFFSGLLPTLATVFDQQEVDQSDFVAVAAPVGTGNAYQLLVLEQISDEQLCWEEVGSNPTRIDPLLLTFDFTGLCGRSTDSNGYSIRRNGQDLGLQYSLRIVRRDDQLVLLGVPGDRTQPEFVIARSNGIASDFVKLSLEPEWRFTRRVFGERALGHIYFTQGVTPPGAILFQDAANDIYANEIRQAVQLGFISGFPDNTFRPQSPLTREQLVSMVLEALDTLPNTNLAIPAQASAAPYPDVEASRWSAAKIQFARTNNIVSGYQDGTFRPAQAVTRAELMAVLRRAAEYGRSLQGLSPQLDAQQQPTNFIDIDAHWGASLIRQMSTYCRVASPLNESGNQFAPDTAAQRNYAAAATLRMLTCTQPQETETPGTQETLPPAAPQPQEDPQFQIPPPQETPQLQFPQPQGAPQLPILQPQGSFPLQESPPDDAGVTP